MPPRSHRPNIVFILADDMGYGDVRHLNPDCAFPTPNLDRLGREGMAFTDAHASSSVCTPSRYSIMTGRYCWRTWLKSKVLFGAHGPLLEEGRPTVASLLADAGYATACFGKWHLGWDWGVRDGRSAPADPEEHKRGDAFDWIDFARPVAGGPCDHGFDRFRGIVGSLDMPPYVWVDDRTPEESPTTWGSAEEFSRDGPRQDGLRADNVLAATVDDTVAFIDSHDGDAPFFVYVPLTAPHTPIAPAPGFAGESGINPYADFCMEVDHRVGQILDALDRKGVAENTLVVFTTDNGASYEPSDCARLEREFGHFCSHVYRGYKSDIWDGGHRLPFLCRWPAVVAPDGHCDEPIGLFDLFATAAAVVGTDFGDDAGEDSVSFLPALRGEAMSAERREALIHHSIDGRFAVRVGRWKLCRCPGSGGWAKGEGDLRDAEARERGLHELQLYDLDADVGERRNLVAEHPDLVDELTRVLHRCVARGRSTPGGAQPVPEAPDFDDWRQVDWLPEIPAGFVIDD